MGWDPKEVEPYGASFRAWERETMAPLRKQTHGPSSTVSGLVLACALPAAATGGGVLAVSAMEVLLDEGEKVCLSFRTKTKYQSHKTRLFFLGTEWSCRANFGFRARPAAFSPQEERPLQAQPRHAPSLSQLLCMLLECFLVLHRKREQDREGALYRRVPPYLFIFELQIFIIT